MKTVVKEKEYSTYNAKCLGYKHIGEYGHDDGFEEQLYLAEDGQHFIYGIGGPNSPYPEPEITLVKEEKAVLWKKRTT
ncbi:MAG: hypothetical protein FWE90_06495 [Defluviitaleaceae bacterium]|nr:hypothetical protein [Defluviitaleaceae bacterium]